MHYSVAVDVTQSLPGGCVRDRVPRAFSALTLLASMKPAAPVTMNFIGQTRQASVTPEAPNDRAFFVNLASKVRKRFAGALLAR